MKIHLYPKIGMGPFIIGNSILEYLKLYSYSFTPAETEENWDEYVFFDEMVEVYVHKKTRIIESIASRISCIYKEIDLIGFDFNDFLISVKRSNIDLEKDSIWLEGDEIQSVYEIQDMGLQVWVDSNNLIRTVFVS